ncbi:MAG: CDP-diacylglycerol--serine O-phosphatidyltransferase [Candidatus Omnitrophica bacterium]|nr:CDP-diacylglycerol--serine O-phosphatidyltransferase [Candidatus Omnitrophota bacterium]
MNYYNLAANLLTGLSLFGGFVSIIFSLETHFTFASWAIIFSVIFDGMDGQVARRNPTPSAFGKELDSLVDVVSFGIAPSILGYCFIYQSFYLWAALALFIYLCCSVFRLAKYNITPKEELTNYFLGLPTTASGGVLASFILIYRRYTQLPPSGVFVLLVLSLAFLMVSRVKYLNLDCLKEILSRFKSSILILLLAVGLSIAIFYWFTGVFLPEIGIFTIFLIYLLFSPFMVKLFKFEPR